jgi:hypothetical protein
MNLDDPKRAFLHREFFDLTLKATIQRARIYSHDATAHGRLSLHSTLRHVLESAARAYVHPVAETDHLRNIAQVADRTSADCMGALRGERFRIGPAQKALNLFLKYLWCAGWIPTPPHCPLDSLIISQFPASQRCNWTDLDSLGAYEKLVASARRLAGAQHLADWELSLYESLRAGRNGI